MKENTKILYEDVGELKVITFDNKSIAAQWIDRNKDKVEISGIKFVKTENIIIPKKGI